MSKTWLYNTLLILSYIQGTLHRFHGNIIQLDLKSIKNNTPSSFLGYQDENLKLASQQYWASGQTTRSAGKSGSILVAKTYHFHFQKEKDLIRYWGNFLILYNSCPCLSVTIFYWFEWIVTPLPLIYQMVHVVFAWLKFYTNFNTVLVICQRSACLTRISWITNQ